MPLPSSKLIVTHHARDRYKERVDSSARYIEIVRHWRRSRSASEKDRRWMRSRCWGHRRELTDPGGRFVYWAEGYGDDRTIFVTEVKRPGVFRLVTVMTYATRRASLIDVANAADSCG
jgi:hypothetical protein